MIAPHNSKIRYSDGEFWGRLLETDEPYDLGLPLPSVTRHYGPGPHPGTGTEQSVHGGEETVVGITSYGDPESQPEATHTNRATFAEMRAFERELRKIKSLKNVRVAPGLGGWAGGHEPTWVVSYKGNGEALSLLASWAKRRQQQAVLVLTPGKGRPVFDLTFERPITPATRKLIEELTPPVAYGAPEKGGWTWYRTQDGGRALRLVSVPEWGSHLNGEGAGGLQALLTEAGLRTSIRQREVGGFLMTMDGDRPYDEFIKKAP